MRKAFVLLSGGIDSTTCLVLAKTAVDQFNAGLISTEDDAAEVIAVSVNYGQRHKKEIDAAKSIATAYGIQHFILKAPEMPNVMLTDLNKEVPHTTYDQIKGVSPTYVPFRNGLLISMLASWAHGLLLAEGEANGVPKEDHTKPEHESFLYWGAHAEDAQGWAYPDCTPEFSGSMANAIYVGTYGMLRLLTPLQYMKKDEIILQGTKYGAPYALSWSCYKGEELQCGQCPTCNARKDGFKRAGITDPTHYAH